jgi:hypothetical protein
VDRQGKQDILNKCISLNKQVSGIETELDTMIEEFNHDTEDGGEIRPEQLSLNTQNILNNYFEILQKMEILTLTASNKLDNLNKGTYSN